jgi:transcriptional regulator with XRE-family HTH domain
MDPVAQARTTWQAKVRKVLEERRLSVRRLALMMGREERTVRQWIREEARPIGEMAAVAQIATALGLEADSLTDGEDAPPRPAASKPAEVEELAKLVPAKLRRLAFALADPETADWLLAQLDLYERARRRARGRQG